MNKQDKCKINTCQILLIIVTTIVTLAAVAGGRKLWSTVKTLCEHHSCLLQPSATIIAALIAASIAVLGWYYTGKKSRTTNKLIENSKEKYQYNHKVRDNLSHFAGAASALNEYLKCLEKNTEICQDEKVKELKKEVILAYWTSTLYQVSVETIGSDLPEQYKNINIDWDKDKGTCKADSAQYQDRMSIAANKIYSDLILNPTNHDYDKTKINIDVFTKSTSLFTYIMYHEAKDELDK